MTHSHEPSYYEIALTNKQVLIVFVVLLICIVAAFFSGVWVGRKESSAPVAVVAQEGGEAASSPAAGEAAIPGELHFFSDEGAETEPSLAQMAEEPKPGTTLLEDLGAGEAEEAATDTPREPVQTAAEPPATEQPESTPVPGGHVIQVFSSADEAQARKLLKELQKGGYPAFLSPVDVSGQTMFRVRVGPYTELTEAEAVADRVRRSFRLDTWVTR